jgi:hypothetical protein
LVAWRGFRQFGHFFARTLANAISKRPMLFFLHFANGNKKEFKPTIRKCPDV